MHTSYLHALVLPARKHLAYAQLAICTFCLQADQGSITAKGGSGLSFRKALYELLRFWSCEGFSSEENYASNVKTGITVVLGRYKQSYEEHVLEPVRSELAQAGQYLDHAARTGMAALLAVRHAGGLRAAEPLHVPTSPSVCLCVVCVCPCMREWESWCVGVCARVRARMCPCVPDGFV